jgi:hypothetical protein
MIELDPSELMGAGILALVAFIWNSLVNRIKRLEDGKVDVKECKLREKVEDQAFSRIDNTLDKLEKTFADKSTDVVGTMKEILRDMKERK